MQNERLISIIISIHNAEKYLEECLTSIRKQTYHNLEIIIINNNSTDNSYEIIKKQQEQDNRIICINCEENIGISNARNIGIKISSGGFISFVNDNDVLDENFYEVLVDIMDKDMLVDVAQCKISKFQNIPYENTEVIIHKNFVVENTTDKIGLISKDSFLYVFQGNKLFRKKIFDTISFPEGREYQDACVIYEEYLKATRIAYTNDTCYWYRNNNDEEPIKLNDLMFAYDKLCEDALNDDNYEYYISTREEQLENYMYVYSTTQMKDKKLFKEMKQTYLVNKEIFQLLFGIKLMFFFHFPTIASFKLKFN